MDHWGYCICDLIFYTIDYLYCECLWLVCFCGTWNFILVLCSKLQNWIGDFWVSLAVPWLPCITLVHAFCSRTIWQHKYWWGGTISESCKRFPFCEESRLNIGPTQLSFQCITARICVGGLSNWGMKETTHHHPVPRLKMRTDTSLQ